MIYDKMQRINRPTNYFYNVKNKYIVHISLKIPLLLSLTTKESRLALDLKIRRRIWSPLTSKNMFLENGF